MALLVRHDDTLIKMFWRSVGFWNVILVFDFTFSKFGKERKENHFGQKLMLFFRKMIDDEWRRTELFVWFPVINRTISSWENENLLVSKNDRVSKISTTVSHDILH